MAYCSSIRLIVVLLAAFTLGNSCRIIKRGLLPLEEKDVERTHRYFRNLVRQGTLEPKGKNLSRITYDDTLAELARKRSDPCKFEHFTVVDPRFINVGQNLYMLSTTNSNEAVNWKKAITSWCDEYKYFKYPNGKTDESKITGHYRQVVWGSTNLVGCDYIMFQKPNDNKFYHHMYICNYGPAGNYVGQAPYQKA